MGKFVIFGRAVISNEKEVHTNTFVEIHQGKVYRLTNFSKDPDIVADVVMPGFIDPHVHCRDGSQSQKETIQSAMEAAAHGGVTQIHDMPNTSPPVLYNDDIKKRLEIASKSRTNVKYSLYSGLSNERSQIKEACQAVNDNSQVAGLKLYAGESVGNLAITDPDDQYKIYKALANLSYSGLLFVHCEKISEFLDETWSVNSPESWSQIRPACSEVESVKDQIKFAIKAGFKGKLHICHASVADSISQLKNIPDTLKVSCGVTPHHLLLNSSSMKNRSRGLYYKVNPPLRSRDEVFSLTRQLLTGNVDWIETDHAPHTINEKLNQPFAPGLPELDTYSNFITSLNMHFQVPYSDIIKLTSGNAVKAFKLENREIKSGNSANLTLIDMSPEKIQRSRLKTKCGWSPYEGMTFPGRCKATIIDGEVAYLAKD